MRIARVGCGVLVVDGQMLELFTRLFGCCGAKDAPVMAEGRAIIVGVSVVFVFLFFAAKGSTRQRA